MYRKNLSNFKVLDLLYFRDLKLSMMELEFQNMNNISFNISNYIVNKKINFYFNYLSQN